MTESPAKNSGVNSHFDFDVYTLIQWIDSMTVLRLYSLLQSKQNEEKH
jgi:hypothetical protein